MAYLNPRILDRGLESLIEETDSLILTSADPLGIFDDALAALIGSKPFPIIVGPQNGTTAGSRKAVVNAVGDGAIEADGTATHWNLLNVAEARLLVSGELANPLPAVTGNSFTLEEFSITLFGPLAEAPLAGSP